MALLSSLLTFWGFFVSRTEQGRSSRNRRNCKYAGGSPPLQPTEAAQLLLDGVKIEPCTIIIMETAKQYLGFLPASSKGFYYAFELNFKKP
jgi:hypothetical protein